MKQINELIIGKGYHLDKEEGFTYVGKDDNGYNFAAFIEDDPYGDIWMFPIEEELLIVKDGNIMSKENRFPQYRLEAPREDVSASKEYQRISNIIKRSDKK